MVVDYQTSATSVQRGAWVLGIALALQGVHMVEHFAQFYQYLVLWYPVKEAHGIVFFLDLEWNHFTFNLAYLVLLSWALLSLRLFERERYAGKAWPRHCFILGYLVQAAHVIEHAARIGQFLESGCTPCPGVAGWFVNGIYLHFTLNTITLVLPAVAFFAYGFWRNLRRAPSISRS